MKRELYGVFVLTVAAGALADNPVALFGDADEAQRWRRANYGDDAHVVPLEATVSETSIAAARDAVAAMTPSTPAAELVPAPDPDAELRGRIRAEEVQRRREDEIRAQVVAELDADASEAQDEPASKRSRRKTEGDPQLDSVGAAAVEPGAVDDQAARDAATARGELTPLVETPAGESR
jgi:hypothetical protein